MGRYFSMMKDGDRLEPHHLNVIYKELNRWRSLRCVAPLRVIGVEDGVSNPEISIGAVKPITIKLTANGDTNGKHGWKAVLWNGTAYVDSGKVGNSNADWAIELNGLICPKSDEVYTAWQNNWGVWTFKAVRHLGMASADINANSNGTVYLWSFVNGTLTNSNTSITAFNYNDLTKVTSGKKVMLTPNANRWLVDFEAC